MRGSRRQRNEYQWALQDLDHNAYALMTQGHRTRALSRPPLSVSYRSSRRMITSIHSASSSHLHDMSTISRFSIWTDKWLFRWPRTRRRWNFVQLGDKCWSPKMKGGPIEDWAGSSCFQDEGGGRYVPPPSPLLRRYAADARSFTNCSLIFSHSAWGLVINPPFIENKARLFKLRN